MLASYWPSPPKDPEWERQVSPRRKLITVEPKSSTCSPILVQNRDRVVSNDDLLQSAWGGRLVADSALTTRITAVRQAFGDNGASRQLVRTQTVAGLPLCPQDDAARGGSRCRYCGSLQRRATRHPPPAQ